LSARTWPRNESSSWPAIWPTYQMGAAERKACSPKERRARLFSPKKWRVKR
jgi:hypothetical protein